MKRYCKPSTMSCDQTGVTRWRTFAMHHQPRSPALRLQLWIQETWDSFVSPSTVNQMNKNSPLEVLSDFPVPLLFLDHERFPISVHLLTPRCWYHLCECLRLGLATHQGCLDAPTAWNQCLPPGAMVGVERGCFFSFCKEIQVIWLVNLQWNMLVPRCIEPCRVVWTC